MLCYCRSAFIKKTSNSILCTPNSFFSVHYLNTIFLTLSHEDKKFSGTISYFKSLCHFSAYFLVANIFATPYYIIICLFP